MYPILFQQRCLPPHGPTSFVHSTPSSVSDFRTEAGSSRSSTLEHLHMHTLPKNTRDPAAPSYEHQISTDLHESRQSSICGSASHICSVSYSVTSEQDSFLYSSGDPQNQVNVATLQSIKQNLPGRKLSKCVSFEDNEEQGTNKTGEFCLAKRADYFSTVAKSSEPHQCSLSVVSCVGNKFPKKYEAIISDQRNNIFRPPRKPPRLSEEEELEQSCQQDAAMKKGGNETVASALPISSNSSSNNEDMTKLLNNTGNITVPCTTITATRPIVDATLVSGEPNASSADPNCRGLCSSHDNENICTNCSDSIEIIPPPRQFVEPDS